VNRIQPMLAVSGVPFDSPEYLFEVKWDGIRALAGVSQAGWQLWGRGGADYAGRYPELAVLRRLPAGTVVDGELVLWRDGRPDLAALLRRHPLVRPEAVRYASRHDPVGYVLFDLPSLAGRSLLGEPLARRRALLAELLGRHPEPGLVFSEGVVGAGRAFYERVVGQGQEGVMAKRLSSRYTPGRRSPAWQKIKPVRELPGVIVGYRPGRSGVRRLLVATADRDGLRYAGRLASGWSVAQAGALQQQLDRLRRARPVVCCPGRAVWVEPAVYCRVRFLGQTGHGRFRHAVFGGLLA
jgi:bifunctional non-homologous end joining protein LigD/DNA ligase-1